MKRINKQAYRENLRQLGLFLEGRYKQLLKQLKDSMFHAAKCELFEEAAMFRDRIDSLSEIIAQTREPKPFFDFVSRLHSGLSAVARDGSQDLILELQKLLRLPKAPFRIEAFDISQICGEGMSGSMVSFLGDWPDKKNYRKFRIKTVRGMDDYAMIREVLRRRYSQRGRKDMPPLPDLVMIDGGKGHLSCAREELKSLGLAKIPAIALAKRLENIYSPCGKLFCLPKDSRLLHFLQRIRDEAHRFAISYHHKLRQKDMRISQLDRIPGIGPKRKQALLQHFKSVQAVKEATLEDLLKLKGIDRKTAENIIKYFK